jgi:hypothetical protein
MVRSFLLLALVLLAAPPAFSHNYLPDSGGALTSIPNIGVSRAAYRVLSGGGQVDVYEFSAKKGQEIYIQMTMPVMERFGGFFPAFLLVHLGDPPVPFADPGLERGRIVDPPEGVLDRAAPHTGAEPAAIAVEHDGSGPVVFDEIFTGTKYWTRQELTVAAPADGTYRIGVYAPDGGVGKYVLATGRAEAFGFWDILGLPAVRWRVREFCGEPLWPDALFWGVLGAAAVAGVGLGAWALLSR